MKHKDDALVSKLWCVALVVCVVFPMGRMVFPYVSGLLDHFAFSAIEAVLSATLGFGLYLVLFG